MKNHNIIVILVIFLFLYEPPIFNINILHILGISSWIYIILNNHLISKFINIKKLIFLYVFFIYTWVYILVIFLINESSIANSSHFIYWMLDIIPICVALTIHFVKKRFTFIDFINALLYVGVIQSILAITSFFLPTVKFFFIGQLIDYGYSNVLLSLSDLRLYGFSSNLTFSTPIVQSIFGVIALYLALNQNWKYLLFVPLLFFSAIINARTSIVIILIGLFAIFIFTKKISFKTFFKTAVIGIALFLVANFGLAVIEENSNETYQWVVKGYEEIQEAIFSDSDQTDGYFSYINNEDRYVVPENFGLLFGVGERVLTSNQYGVESDIGYINDVWFGGILYSAIIYIFFIVIIFSLREVNYSNNRLGSFLIFLFLGTFIVANIKGYIFVMNNLTNLLFIIFSFVALNKNLKIRDKKIYKKVEYRFEDQKF